MNLRVHFFRVQRMGNSDQTKSKADNENLKMNDKKAENIPSADQTEHCRSRMLKTATDRSDRSSISCDSLKSDISKCDPPFFSNKWPESCLCFRREEPAALQRSADLTVLDQTCLRSRDSGEDVEEKEELGEKEVQRLMEHTLSLQLGSDGDLESFQTQLKGSLKQIYKPQMNRPYLKIQVYQKEDISKDLTMDVTEGFKTRPGRSTSNDSPMDIVEVFSSRPGLSPPRCILTLGEAGAGKSALVRSVVLDWCEDRCLQDVHLLVPLTFSRLNQLRNQSCSLLQLLWTFCPGLKESGLTDVSQLRVLFILDGLDECRLPLDFTPHARPKADLHTLMPVPMLLESLLEGGLLHKAQVWVTSRPPAPSLPASLIHKVTELHGLTLRQQKELSDSQQKELSDSQQKELSDSQQKELSVSQQKELSDSQQEELSVSQQEENVSESQPEGLSHLPLIHSITARLWKGRGSRPTQTQTLVHFLSYHMRKMQHSYSLPQRRVHEVVLSLSTLASQLKGPHSKHNRQCLGQHTFCEEHLKWCGVSRLEALVWSGLCVEVDSGIPGPRCCECGRKAPLYKFVDESVRGFLSTLFSGVSQCEDRGSNSSMRLLQCLREMDQEETRAPQTALCTGAGRPQRVTALSSWNHMNQWKPNQGKEHYDHVEAGFSGSSSGCEPLEEPLL